MSEYIRTAIRRLDIEGYRSIRALSLADIPNLVVLHGPNGAGKSNILAAAQLVLKAMYARADWPQLNDAVIPLPLTEANRLLGIRPEDFFVGGPRKIRIRLELLLGSRVAAWMNDSGQESIPMSLELVIEPIGDDEIQLRTTVSTPRLDDRKLRRLRKILLRLLQISPAYRVPGGIDDPEKALFRSLLSDNPDEQEAIGRLRERLGKAGLFGLQPGDQAELVPRVSGIYKEEQVRIRHPKFGELPLRNLGSGEQQVVYMLAQRVITQSPIALVEEPEAHLHTTLMGKLAKILLDSVSGEDGRPDVDQLWIATHHHHFALARDYFDVQLVDGATTVSKKPRALAARHFYEPGPIWEALRQLASSAKERQAVVFRNAEGQKVTAGQILESIENDPEQRVAMEYARTMTEAMVLAMRQRAGSS
jgi:energy-coupling factor transporter ATP-binding protein EcfA2